MARLETRKTITAAIAPRLKSPRKTPASLKTMTDKQAIDRIDFLIKKVEALPDLSDKDDVKDMYEFQGEIARILCIVRPDTGKTMEEDEGEAVIHQLSGYGGGIF
jgi:hypothetical protein